MPFRTPAFPWIVTGLLGALSLHGLAWFFSRVYAVPLAEALHETQRQVMLALFWMVCAIALWSMHPPKSRLTALFHIMACAFVVCFLGSGVAFFNWMVSQNVAFDGQNLLIFSGYALLMILGQLFLALPSATLLQQIVLAPARQKAIQD
ncbi:MAG: hypothetical protein QM645_07660 [Asticcacaulis sp.]